jgi:two-component system nitrogen regulation response regulator NtrX
MKTILTLEDELEINDFYKDFLEDLGYTVINATSSQEVMDVVRTQSVDLLIADNLLQNSKSEKDGVETARAVKALVPDIKIIMISAHYPPEVENDYKAQGIDLLLRKPFAIPALIECIKTLVPIDSEE